ncbi:hemerythrin domain-containing protein [Dyella solisilvae]|uniref:Hemerythrin domain-containing protein n=1 Tax=Dyella solisilvae TaxID=1920168 RepID=A0A370K6B5_9GAMM|nr:hemerythrin domain-containing protein [Dyella solisilvae]RDI98186.1 hemerythrin domain-containing protein [Dyella solisilvae]
MSFMRKLFGQSATPTAATAAAPAKPTRDTAPGTRIRYHPGLVPQLTTEHQALLHTFGSIRTAAIQGNLAGATERLEQFRVQLQSHLLTENVRLYIYLEHEFAQDPTSYALVHEFRREMDGIGKALAGFIHKYQNLAQQPDLATSFLEELARVGRVLMERIRREESTLYPLYAS